MSRRTGRKNDKGRKERERLMRVLIGSGGIIAQEAGMIVLNNPLDEAIENGRCIEVMQPSNAFDLNMLIVVKHDESHDRLFKGEVTGGELGGGGLLS